MITVMFIVMTCYDLAHSRNLIIMFISYKKDNLYWGMGGSDGCRNDTLLIVMGYSIGGTVSGTLGLQITVRGTLGLQKTGSRCMETTIRSSFSSPSAFVNNPWLAYIWMYACWAVHPDTYLDIWVRRVIIIIGPV